MRYLQFSRAQIAWHLRALLSLSLLLALAFPALSQPIDLRSIIRPSLELGDWSWRQSSGGLFVEVEGQVKNTSPYPLPAVQVVVSFFTADKRFLTSATALVYYTPLLARQTTPFRVTVPHNPAMKTAKLEFQELGGGTIQVTTKGYWILVAQQALQTAGYNPGPLDGKIGSQMRSALRQFQKAKGYKVTGELNKETQEALLNIWITHTQRLMEKLVKELQDLADKQGHTEKKPGADSP